jgi:hypothetical protein
MRKYTIINIYLKLNPINKHYIEENKEIQQTPLSASNPMGV